MKRTKAENYALAFKHLKKKHNARFSLDSGQGKRIASCIDHYLKQGNVSNSDGQIMSDVLSRDPGAKEPSQSTQDFLESVREVLIGQYGWKNAAFGSEHIHCLPPPNWNINAMQPPPVSNERRESLANELAKGGAKMAIDYVQSNDRETALDLVRRATAAVKRLPQGTLKMHLQDSSRYVVHCLDSGMVVPRQVCEKLASLLESTDLIVSKGQQSGYSNQY